MLNRTKQPPAAPTLDLSKGPWAEIKLGIVRRGTELQLATLTLDCTYSTGGVRHSFGTDGTFGPKGFKINFLESVAAAA